MVYRGYRGVTSGLQVVGEEGRRGERAVAMWKGMQKPKALPLPTEL